MKFTSKSRTVVGLLLASLLGWTAVGSVQQDADLQTRVKKLEQDQLASQKRLVNAEDHILKLEARLSLTEAWFAALPAATKRLEAGLAKTLADGFTQAGTNTGAREALLDTLNQLSKDFVAPLPKPSGAETRRRR